MTSSKPKGALSNPNLKDKQIGLTKASTVIQTYVTMILQQPDLSLTALPNLSSHQQTARDHANNWNNTILPSLSKTDADIIDYANQFDSFYEKLVNDAKNVKDAKKKKSLVEGLHLLKSTIKDKDAHAHSVVTALLAFHKNLDKDSKNFQADANQAAVKITGDNGVIQSLNKQLNTIQDAMHKDIGLMAGGAAVTAVGVAMIVFGAISEIPSGGMSTVLIGGGVMVVSSGVIMETLGSTDYSAQIDEQRRVQEQLAGDNIQLAGLTHTKKQVSGFVSGLVDAIAAASSLKAAWQTLDVDLQEMISAVKDVDPSSDWLLSELSRAQKDWKVALDQAKRLQPDGKVPTKLYKDVQTAFKRTAGVA